MGKLVFGVFLSFLFYFPLTGHVLLQPKTLFSEFSVVHEKEADGAYGRVLSLVGAGQFYQKVLKNKKPVVVKIFSKNGSDNSFYNEVARSFKGRVDFVSMDVACNQGSIKAIMTQLRIVQANMPLFLFFRNRTLLLPPENGISSAQKLKTVINQRFFSQKQVLVGDENSDLLEESRLSGQGDSTLERLKEISNKLKRSLSGIQDVSKEVQAYRYSKRWKQHP
ncbi:hypothetical protein KAT92_01410 [Candidatus Babeliales bacterium]|nr:hypothetical protein [Candidatus Babeliales bacterium]